MFFRLILLFAFTSGVHLCNAQLAGDINGDNLVDATDYFIMREHLIDGQIDKQKADLNRDARFNVLDIIVLESYLRRGTAEPTLPNGWALTTKAQLEFGRFDQLEGTVEVILRNAEPLGGFDISLSGLDSVVKVLGGSVEERGFDILVSGKRIIGIAGEGKPLEKGADVLLKLQVGNFLESKVCFEKVVLGNWRGDRLRLKTGGCGDELYTPEGYEALKAYARISTKPIKNYDYNEDGKLDVRDVQGIQCLLFRQGEKAERPRSENRSRVKLTYGKVDTERKEIEIIMQNSLPVAAFQFEVSGAGDLRLMSGLGEETGTELVTEGNRVLAFSNERSIIPPGKRVLGVFAFSEVLETEACINRPYFVDVSGIAMPGFIRGCATLQKKIYGCTDKSALNYNPNANADDGSCAFAEDDPNRDRYNQAKRTWWEAVKHWFRGRKHKF